MNIDSGSIRLWRDLTDEEKESGRWVKLGEDELAIAESMDMKERLSRMREIFEAKPKDAAKFFTPKKYGE